jgi:hypothetical protein
MQVTIITIIIIITIIVLIVIIIITNTIIKVLLIVFINIFSPLTSRFGLACSGPMITPILSGIHPDQISPLTIGHPESRTIVSEQRTASACSGTPASGMTSHAITSLSKRFVKKFLSANEEEKKKNYIFKFPLNAQAYNIRTKQSRTCVNFTNVLRVPFLYESFSQSFFCAYLLGLNFLGARI